MLRARIEGLDAQIAMLRELVETANRRAERAEAIADSLQRHADAAQKQTEAALKHVEAVQLLLADQRPKRRGWLGWRAA